MQSQSMPESLKIYCKNQRLKLQEINFYLILKLKQLEKYVAIDIMQILN